jgi:glycosyltransferase involved in cell wall biosynthesis
VHVLLEALEGVEARAVIVGFGDYRAELEAMATGRVLFTGPLEHRHLVHLLALADACVVPSIFPEAFGMVAAEAAAAGCPPLVARHSGLAEVAEGLEAEYPPHLRDLTSFVSGDAADLHTKLTRLLALGTEDRREISEAARRAAVERWSWASVAERLLATAR